MSRIGIVWLAGLAAGALVAAGAGAAGSPTESRALGLALVSAAPVVGQDVAAAEPRGATAQAPAEVELKQRRTRNPDRLRYYRVRITHEGSVRFRSLTQLGPGFLQNNLDDRTDSYSVRSSGPIAVSVGCLTFLQRFRLPSTRFEESCRAANRRSVAAILPGEIDTPARRAAWRAARRGLPRALRRELPRLDRAPRALRKRVAQAPRKTGDEIYTFGPSLLVGTITGGRQAESTEPITTGVPGVPNLVFCTPQEQTRERVQTSPQTGLVVRLLSGDGVFRPGSSEGGLRILARAVSGAPPAGFRETLNQVECPTSNPAFPRVMQRAGVVEGTDVWQPTDLLTSRDRLRGGRRARALEFTKPPGTFGKKFTVKVGSIENGRALPGRGTTLTRDEHDYVLTFTPCPKNGTVRRGC